MFGSLPEPIPNGKEIHGVTDNCESAVGALTACSKIRCMNEQQMTFVTTGRHPSKVMDELQPGGQFVLNRTPWRDKEARSCAITRIYNEGEKVFIVVKYRPRGFLNFVGNTLYDGWSAKLLNRAKDGTLLDGAGRPLPEKTPGVHLEFEMYQDVDFNGLDLGELVQEVEIPGPKKVRREDFIKEIEGEMQQGCGDVVMGTSSSFVASHRHRPFTKLCLSSAPSGESFDRFGTQIINLDRATPYLDQVLVDRFTHLLSSYIEGRISLKTLGTSVAVFIDLNDAIVDVRPAEAGLDTDFDAARTILPTGFLDLMARFISSTYLLDVSVVEEAGEFGLILRHVSL